MRRRLFNIGFGSAAAVSLLVGAIAILLAAVAVWHSVWIAYQGRAYTVSAASIGSSVWLTAWLDSTVPPSGWSAGRTPRSQRYWTRPPSDHPQVLGIACFYDRTDPSAASPFGGNRPYATLILPHWFIALLATMFPAAWMVRRHREHSGPGQCRVCGYDCRGPADGTFLDRCPECGTDLPPPKPASDDRPEEPRVRFRPDWVVIVCAVVCFAWCALVWLWVHAQRGSEVIPPADRKLAEADVSLVIASPAIAILAIVVLLRWLTRGGRGRNAAQPLRCFR